MPDDTPDLAHLRPMFVGDQTMIDTLQRVATLAVEAVAPAAFAGLTMLVDGEPHTGVFTDPDAPEIDQAQYDADEGPCLDSFRTGEIYRVTSVAEDGAWPAFRKACMAHDIHSTMSLPIVIDEVRHGALNLYAHDDDAFHAEHIKVGRRYAAQAAVVIAYARSYWDARQLAEHLERALTHRAEIEQAKGIIIATTGVDPDRAFEVLAQQSQHENRKLRDVAMDLVKSKIRPSPPAGR